MDEDSRHADIQERKNKLEEEFKKCQSTIENQFDENERTQISEFMLEKITQAAEKAARDVAQAEKDAYHEAMEKFGNKKKTDAIAKVCHFKKWDEEAADIMKQS